MKPGAVVKGEERAAEHCNEDLGVVVIVNG